MKKAKTPAVAELPAGLLKDIRALIEEARRQTAVAVNVGLTLLYWRMGQRIHLEVLGNERAAYGEQIVATLSRQLVAEYGRGYTEKNLRRMIQFAEAFPDEQIVASLWRQLSWSHFRELLPLKKPFQRDFYAEMCRIERWSVRALRERIDSMLYERTALSKKPDELIEQELAVLRTTGDMSLPFVLKDPYVLDFLGLQDRYLEKDLEDAILRELETFILELGTGFSFIARQKRIQLDNDDFYIDLLFYNRKLKRLVAIDLKLGDFKAEYKGQMELYQTDVLVDRAAKSLAIREKIAPSRMSIQRGGIVMSGDGVDAQLLGVREAEAKDYKAINVPDMLSYLQAKTELTRKTIAEILARSGRLNEVQHNPQQFLEQAQQAIASELHNLMIDGIKYERISGQEYEMMLFEAEEITGALTSMIEVDNSIYDAVLFESEVERAFAEAMSTREDIKLFVKLPGWFKIETPIGTYNPDWAIVREHDKKVYLVRETKSTKEQLKLRGSEWAKIQCGKAHFDTLGVDFAHIVSASEIG